MDLLSLEGLIWDILGLLGPFEALGMGKTCRCLAETCDLYLGRVESLYFCPGEQTATAVANAICRCRRLKELRLTMDDYWWASAPKNGMDLDQVMCDALCVEAIALQVISLSGPITAHCLVTTSRQRIVALDLSNNNRGASLFANYVCDPSLELRQTKRNFPCLRELRLSRHRSQRHSAALPSKLVVKLAEACPSLRSLDLADALIRDGVKATHIEHLCRCCQKLIAIDLSNVMTWAEFRMPCAALASGAPNLVVLALKSLFLSDLDLVTLSNGCPRLRRLRIDYCRGFSVKTLVDTLIAPPARAGLLALGLAGIQINANSGRRLVASGVNANLETLVLDTVVFDSLCETLSSLLQFPKVRDADKPHLLVLRHEQDLSGDKINKLRQSDIQNATTFPLNLDVFCTDAQLRQIFDARGLVRVIRNISNAALCLAVPNGHFL